MRERHSFRGWKLMARRDYYRLRAEECLVASRACSDASEAAQLTLMAAGYLDLAEMSGRVLTHQDLSTKGRAESVFDAVPFNVEAIAR